MEQFGVAIGAQVGVAALGDAAQIGLAAAGVTLWVCEVTGGPLKFSPTKPGKTHLGLEAPHRDLKISPEEFDEVAAELGRSLDFAKVPAREKAEVLAAFAAQRKEVTAGYKAK